MSYRVEELAAEGGVSVDTVRYYQGLGLLEPPRREGRVALYDEAHRDRLAAIRSLADSGFTLRQIGELVEMGAAPDADPLLLALNRHRPAATLTLAELSERTGVAEALLEMAVGAGLLHPADIGGQPGFDEEQAAMVDTFGRLLASGIDLDPLIALAMRHAESIGSVVAEGVELYRAAAESERDADRERLAAEIQALMPAVTQLVADHFSRTLIEHMSALVDEA